ncbi:signal recognition particle-docking protein FtsY [Lapidilactobacillus gannanensis]|uniref:Signal recognition particle receptor FtsY n=1 Tax=Lapidilactobacillus gannanensis TaxID=2486002 RepID=A0ABW4BR71_9LACO|nr:signal recognition particle-docking protein FtsY [Lapidilactobacillus gannanensis]
MGFFDRVKKAFGGGKAESTEPTEKKATVAADDTENSASGSTTADLSTSETVSATGQAASTSATTEKSVVTQTSLTNENKQADEQSALPAAEQAASDSAAPESSDQSLTSQATKLATQASTVATSAANETSTTSVDAESTSESLVTPTSVVSATSETSATTTTDETTTDYDRGLAKSRHGFAARLNEFLAGFRSVDEDFFEDLEGMLIEADVGFETAMTISNQLRDEVKLQNAKTKKQVGLVIVEKMVDLYGDAGAEEDNQLHFAAPTAGPTVFLFVGVNGAGKTTTVGKLSAQLKAEGKKVLLAACDTFRAGAIEQLAEWARRVGVDIVKSEPGADPASVAFEAVKKAKAENYDVLLVDTAGRLQNKVNLMNELAKMKRVIVRELPAAPQEVLLVLDASTGQNALNQAKQFQATTDVTGIVLTKLDGSSKGGIVIAIRNELHLPVKLVGLGEHVGDLQAFNAEKFVYGLFKGLIDEAAN